MTELAFSCEWLTTGQDAPELRETVAQFTMRAGNLILTRNEDAWSKTVRDSVLVSVYPLAIWLAASWWRLNYEPLPKHIPIPSLDWRMAHEIGAANHGYVWPHIVLATDGEAMHMWAAPSAPDSRQSVKYLNGLSQPHAVKLDDFNHEAARFIELVLSRLHTTGYPDTDLASLWRLILEDRADPESAKLRRMEAQLGYDPDECPDAIIAEALALESRMGMSTLSELAPVFGKCNADPTLDEISRLANGNGVIGAPEINHSPLDAADPEAPPWSRAVRAARNLRNMLGNRESPIDDSTLYGLFGLTPQAVTNAPTPQRQKVGLAVPDKNGRLKFTPRKRHPISQRFEFGRFLGDYINSGSTPDNWLASTDLVTARQKFQRAFASELLCPIESLIAYLNDDYSESAIDDAAGHFRVSEQTIEWLLVNNGHIASRAADGGLPYRTAA